jgi:hypothetical protein
MQGVSRQGEDASAATMTATRRPSRHEIEPLLPISWPARSTSELLTPRLYLDAVVKVLGEIELDPASSAAAQEHVKAARWFGPYNDSLSQVWNARVFLYPPIESIQQFAAKMVDSWTSGAMPEGIMLTPNSTDTAWCHHLGNACSAICFKKRRIRFIEIHGVQFVRKELPQGQLFFYFGRNVSTFTEVFGKFGSVARPYRG